MKHVTKKIVLILVVVILLSAILTACNDVELAVYDDDSVYIVETQDSDNALVFMPKDVVCKRGLIFYVGTAIQPSSYERLATALASKGYFVAVPKIKGGLAYFMFNEQESILEQNPDIKFVVGGHSQGGGAGAKRILQERYSNNVAGGLFLSPLFFADTDLKDWDKSALLIEAEFDSVLNANQKADAKAMMPKQTTQKLIDGGNHMGYSNNAFMADGKATITAQQQQDKTVEYILEFFKTIIW